MKHPILFLTALLILYASAALFSPPPFNEGYNVYWGKGNIFNKAFAEPFEILYIVCYNGDIFSLSTKTQGSIHVDAYYIQNFLKEQSKELTDVCIMMHNHFANPGFSYANSINLKILRRMGYRGSFCIYITPTKKIVCDRVND